MRGIYDIFYKEDGGICIFGVSYGEGDRDFDPGILSHGMSLIHLLR